MSKWTNNIKIMYFKNMNSKINESKINVRVNLIYYKC